MAPLFFDQKTFCDVRLLEAVVLEACRGGDWPGKAPLGEGWTGFPGSGTLPILARPR